MILCDFGESGRFQLRGEIENVLWIKALPGKWWGSRRKWLGRINALARHISVGRDGTFFDRPDRSARHAIEHEREAHLRDLRHSINPTSVHGDRHKIRLGAEVVVPQSVMRRLKVPVDLASGCIQTEECLGKEIGAKTIPAVEVVARRA